MKNFADISLRLTKSIIYTLNTFYENILIRIFKMTMAKKIKNMLRI